jgi:hypothetical protein
MCSVCALFAACFRGCGRASAALQIDARSHTARTTPSHSPLLSAGGGAKATALSSSFVRWRMWTAPDGCCCRDGDPRKGLSWPHKKAPHSHAGLYFQAAISGGRCATRITRSSPACRPDAPSHRRACTGTPRRTAACSTARPLRGTASANADRHSERPSAPFRGYRRATRGPS